MKVDDSKKQYLVDEIIRYYENKEKSLINIFGLNEQIFGLNFYGNIVGDSFNSKVVDLVNELIKQRKLEDFITIVRKKFYPIFANKYVGELLIQILNEIFTEEPDKFLKFYQLFISHLNISHLNISKKIKEIIPEVETSEDITNFINLLMQIDEEQEDCSYVENFVYFIIETSSFQENKLREWSKNYIKNYNGPKKLIPKPKKFSDYFSNIFRKKFFFSKFILILPVIIVSILWYINRLLPKTDASGDYIFATGKVPEAYVKYDWIVTDQDPKGLNCRMLKEYWGISMSNIEVPDIFYLNNTHNIRNWSVITTFKTGTRLRPQTTQFGGNIFLKDKQGKVWVPVGKEPIGKNTFDDASCFVRANKRFIEPILRTD